MIKNNKIKLIISSLITILPVFIGLILWNQLPEQIVTHWSFDGTPDGWSSRVFTVLGLPLILLAIHLVCLFITFLDPKNENQTKTVFNLVIWITPIVSIYANGAIYLGAFNIDVPVQIFASLFTGLIFIIVGSYLPKCKQNYTIGIKIPWTLNDEANWNATHKFSSKFWIIGGLLMIACGFLPKNIFIWALFGVIFLITLIPFIYSYVYYAKNK
jgi:uncharacterized membrane protein